MRIYLYKMVADNNGAPCIHNGLLSLAICKPIIRKTANIDDLIFGFAGDVMHSNNHPIHFKNRLIYVARITDIITNGSYYRDNKYIKRGDCIYEWNMQECKFDIRPDAKYHESGEDLVHDLGKFPIYDRNMVLISNDFRYFGKSGTSDYKNKFQNIKVAIESLKRGYLVNHKLDDDLLKLKNLLWQNTTKVSGIPTHHLPNGLNFIPNSRCR